MVSWSIETLRDLSPILAIVFFIISVYLTFKLRRKKSLAYETVTDTSLISVGKAIESEVDIIFQGKKVEDVHLLQVRIMNDGNEHVKKEDFKKPITFEFNPDVEIMDKSAKKKSSENIEVTLDLKAQNVVEVIPTLLNKKDWFIVNFLLNKYENFNLSLHAVDIGEIKVYRPPFLIHYNLALSLMILLIAFTAFSFIWSVTVNGGSELIFKYGLMFFAAVIATLTLLSYPIHLINSEKS